MKIIFYGRLTELIAPEVELDTNAVCSVAQLRERLAAAYPRASKTLASGRVRACIGETLVTDDHLVHPEDRIEFMPPVSGG